MNGARQSWSETLAAILCIAIGLGFLALYKPNDGMEVVGIIVTLAGVMILLGASNLAALLKAVDGVLSPVSVAANALSAAAAAHAAATAPAGMVPPSAGPAGPAGPAAAPDAPRPGPVASAGATGV